MTKQQPSFTQNINYLARNIHLLERGRELLTPSAVRALETAIKLPLDDIVLDVKKGVTEYGRRKIDVQPNLNSKRDSSWVTYSGITIFGTSRDEGYRINFAPIFRPQDIAHQINLAIENFNTQVNDPERVINNLESQLVILDKPDDGHQWLLRYTDTTTTDTSTGYTSLSRITLHVTPETVQYAHEPNVEYFWYKTTSSILTLANSLDIIISAVIRAAESAQFAEIKAKQAEDHAKQTNADLQDVGLLRDQAEGLYLEVNTAVTQFLRTFGYTPIGPYSSGLVIEKLTDVVKFPNGTFWELKLTTTRPYIVVGNPHEDSQYMQEIPFATYKDLQKEAITRALGDANLQAQISNTVPLEASAFSPISWHAQSVENSVTIPPNKNAWSFGPTMTIAEGQTVTVGEGSTWTIANGEQVNE